ncbi:tRNA glutamyl-Q(34) synthetase GluQRS [soil metagenome]
MSEARPYVGRFAPSPTGRLHAGSLVAALASWLDARAHGGRWLVRIEDVDLPRCVPGAAEAILDQLQLCGLTADEAPVWQSTRGALYAAALQKLRDAGWAYDCACTRREIELAAQASGTPKPRHGDLVYPGTCRTGLHGKPARATRVLTSATNAAPWPALSIAWQDRRLGAQQQDLTQAIGDFVLKRADGLWAYQLAVVVDDAAQGVTHVVRGEDLADNTPRQIHLQRLLGLHTPIYLHTPLVRGADGEKLSKQNGAQALDLGDPLVALRSAGGVLGIECDAPILPAWLAGATAVWRARTTQGWHDRGFTK